MCGRFALFAPASTIAETFGTAAPSSDRARYNIAPSQDILAIFEDPEDGQTKPAEFRWGLIPSWAKDKKIGYKMINARGETARKKPAFRSAFKRRRLIIPASGFYEWRNTPDPNGGKKPIKQPFFITSKSGEPLAFAGLWERWTDPETGEEVRSATIITTGPNELMANIHDRMPVILPKSEWAGWLDREQQDGDAIEPLIQSYDADKMTAWPVGKDVGNVRNQGEELITRVDDPEDADG